METDKMSTASSVGAAERRPLLQALVIERRILFGCTCFTGLCTFLWIAAVCTKKWVHIEGGNGIYLPTERYFMSSDTGVWEMCRYLFEPLNKTAPPQLNITGLEGVIKTRCTNYLAPPVLLDRAYDVNIANYVRTMISFGIISLFVMAMGCGFSMYTFKNPRYMFKRLAAGIHFISTSCTFVVVQVMMSSVEDMKKKVIIYPDKAYHYYNISFFLAWFVVLVNFFAAASFLWYSRKRKGDKAATDELAMADEPTIIGR
ncbi:hypothetical protein PYW08_016458 [Mythimna loreyi]|uniref:Uncharacterized protein n=1 Tax=Mythimna loreyi TaxID=667449 RepID=A0ACC2QY26_9NEOP|nr:hypothetical protein PYW08_016458 [Mythimna loreyi]